MSLLFSWLVSDQNWEYSSWWFGSLFVFITIRSLARLSHTRHLKTKTTVQIQFKFVNLFQNTHSIPSSRHFYLKAVWNLTNRNAPEASARDMMTHSAYALPVPYVSLLPHVQLFTVCVGEVKKKRGNNQYITSDSFNDLFFIWRGWGWGVSTMQIQCTRKKNNNDNVVFKNIKDSFQKVFPVCD